MKAQFKTDFLTLGGEKEQDRQTVRKWISAAALSFAQKDSIEKVESKLRVFSETLRKALAEPAANNPIGIAMWRLRQRPDWKYIDETAKTAACEELRVKFESHMTAWRQRTKCSKCGSVNDMGYKRKDLSGNYHCGMPQCAQAAYTHDLKHFNDWLANPYPVEPGSDFEAFIEERRRRNHDGEAQAIQNAYAALR